MSTVRIDGGQSPVISDGITLTTTVAANPPTILGNALGTDKDRLIAVPNTLDGIDAVNAPNVALA